MPANKIGTRHFHSDTQKTMATDWSREISYRSAKTRCKILSSAHGCSLLAVCVNLSCPFKNKLDSETSFSRKSAKPRENGSPVFFIYSLKSQRRDPEGLVKNSMTSSRNVHKCCAHSKGHRVKYVIIFDQLWSGTITTDLGVFIILAHCVNDLTAWN